MAQNSYADPTRSDCDRSGAGFPYEFDCPLDGDYVCGYRPLTNEIYCNISKCETGPDSVLYAVSTDSNTIATFGSCFIDGIQHSFCCTFDDNAGEVELVTLMGTDGSQEPIGFYYSTTNEWLEPTHTGSLVAQAYGLGGFDIVLGSKSEDKDYLERLHGGEGTDEIRGHEGGDELYGEGGDDLFLDGGPGPDKVSGGTGNDILYGGDGADWLHGGHGVDELFGGAGPDVLFGGRGNDELYGGAQADILCETTWPVGVTCPTTQTLEGDAGADKAGVFEHWFCPASGSNLVGAMDVEECIDDDFDWSGVATGPSAVVPGGSPTPYAECVEIGTWGT